MVLTFTPSTVTPQGKDNPEGFDVVQALKPLIKGFCLDYGCGTGRLCHVVGSEHYLGYDPNSDLIKEARLRNPEYRFTTECPDASDTVLAYTVFLHIEPLVFNVDFSRLIICEITGRKWRNPGHAWNREISEYEEIFGPAVVTKYPYKHYPDTDISIMVFDH